MKGMFERFAVQKKKTGAAVIPFLDSKCLNFGKNWLLGFVNGLLKSQMIVLFMSDKVLFSFSSSTNTFQALAGIIKNAATSQDNVLAEYLLN